ncbi:MAG TPA: 50S ribosomal protein L25/general stress protein Ctc [Alphaproteobacteria bacterium]|nr:50S ribosomal protein L25/general stress protein Ctc [Alphaproteobacteria bacterium]
MSEVITLAAELRDRAGKGVARATRRQGRVPGVIYGGQEPPALISMDRAELGRHVHGATFFTHVFELKVDGKAHRVLPRDVQLHPVSDLPIHVDFLRVDAGTVIEVAVPVHFINHDASPGLKRGGVLNVVRHEIDLRCPVESIPEHITIDLAGTDVGESIHISRIALPEGVKPKIERDFTVATIAAPSALRGTAEETTAAAATTETPAAETTTPAASS